MWIDPETGERHVIYPSKEFMRDLTAFNNSECKHEQRVRVLVPDKNGNKHLRDQCRACGCPVGPARPRSEASPSTPDWDKELYDSQKRKREDERTALYRSHIQLQAKQKAQGLDDYSTYRKSPEWQAKRLKVLERAKGICEGCGDQPATVIHHLTYEHIYDELLFELVALCRGCHEKCHPEHEEGDDFDMEMNEYEPEF
jgi:hypothetical protein